MNKIRALNLNQIPEPVLNPRPISTHLHPCVHCPSAHGPGDPESDDYLRFPKDSEERSDFSCGWRNEKFCQGWAKKKWEFDVREKELGQNHEEEARTREAMC